MRRRQIWQETTMEQELLAEVPAPAVKDAHSCPKCGRDLPKRGAHFHIRACKG